MTTEEVTGIFDQALNQKFSASVAMKATVNRSARVMRHPLENGSTIVDHMVVEPVEIELYIVLRGDDMKNGYAELTQSLHRGEILTVQTKVDSYPNMVIDGLPHEETSDMIDLLALSVRMIEAKFVSVEYSPAPRKPSNGKTANRGEQTGKQKQSVLYGIFK